MPVYRRKVRGKRQDRWSAKFQHDQVVYRQGGFDTRAQAQDWIDTERAALRRGKSSLVTVNRAAAIAPLIAAYADDLAKNGRSEKYVYNSRLRLTRLAEDCPWMNLGDFIDPSKLERWRDAKPVSRHDASPLQPKTLNQYLDHAEELADWLLAKKHIPTNPYATVGRLHAPKNQAYRRAASLEELQRLMAKAPPARTLFYRFVIYAPLRRAALEGIEWRDLNLTAARPTLTLRRELAKNRRETKLAIRQDLAADLQAARGEAGDRDKVFPVVPRTRELAADLAAAGIAFADAEGSRRLDLHAFRKTAIRLLKEAGVSLDDAHVVLQHRDRRTTEMSYDDDMVDPRILDAVERMPAIRGTVSEESTAANSNRQGLPEGTQKGAHATNHTEATA